MNSQELCLHCAPFGFCVFQESAEQIAKAVPPLKKQTKISPASKATIEAANASMLISNLRKKAREEWNCTDPNKVNPDYPGKANL
jgi:hypothetical protein